MKLTPAIKGQLTKLCKMHVNNSHDMYLSIRHLFNRFMPKQQAKHATKKYLANLN